MSRSLWHEGGRWLGRKWQVQGAHCAAGSQWRQCSPILRIAYRDFPTFDAEDSPRVKLVHASGSKEWASNADRMYEILEDQVCGRSGDHGKRLIRSGEFDPEPSLFVLSQQFLPTVAELAPAGPRRYLEPPSWQER